MNAAILARVSTGRQAERDRHSLPMQREMMERFAADQGWTVVTTFEIPGESAFVEDRPQFFAAIEAAERREFDVLLIYDVSRFARNQWVFHTALRRLRLAGVRVWEMLAGQFLDEQSPVVIGVKSGAAEEESARQSARIRHAKAHRFSLGLPVGDVPFGYARGNPPEPIPSEAAAVVDAFHLRSRGVGYTEIARMLNARGLRPRSRRGLEVFGVANVQAMLENDFYCGYIRHRDRRARGIHQPIIEEDLWESAQAAVRPRQSRALPRVLLSGIVRCVRCDHQLWTKRSGRKNVITYYGEGRKGCGVRAVWRAEAVDAEVERLMQEMVVDESWLAYVDQQARIEGAQATASHDPAIAERRRRAMELYLSGDLSRDEWLRIREETRATPAVTPTRLYETAERLKSVGALWDTALLEERREWVSLLLQSVDLDLLERRAYVRPWPETAGLFTLRQEWCRQTGPGRDRTVPAYIGRYWIGEMLAA